MVRTRENILPTPTPATQGALDPTIRAATRGGGVLRGRGTCHGRRPTKGIGQTPSPSRDRAVAPPAIKEVVTEGDEGKYEQIQEKKVPPQPTPEMINQLLTYLSRLFDQGLTPPIFSTLTPQVP